MTKSDDCEDANFNVTKEVKVYRARTRVLKWSLWFACLEGYTYVTFRPSVNTLTKKKAVEAHDLGIISMVISNQKVFIFCNNRATDNIEQTQAFKIIHKGQQRKPFKICCFQSIFFI